jgi:hypothetical protein
MKSRKKAKTQRPRVGGYVPYSRTSNKNTLIVTVSLAWILGSLALVWGILFLSGVVTLGGVPASIVGKFLKDSSAVSAFFTGDRIKLHQRLEQLGIEEDIKAYYRPQIPDEVMLDLYIHQLLYDRTGYVGNNYIVTPRGDLVLKTSGETRLRQELQDLKRY